MDLLGFLAEHIEGCFESTGWELVDVCFEIRSGESDFALLVPFLAALLFGDREVFGLGGDFAFAEEGYEVIELGDHVGGDEEELFRGGLLLFRRKEGRGGLAGAGGVFEGDIGDHLGEGLLLLGVEGLHLNDYIILVKL